MRIALVFALSLALMACGGGSGGGGDDDGGPVFFAFTTFQDASVVIGQADFTGQDAHQGGAVAANTVAGPGAPCVVGARLFVPDLVSNRVLGFNAIPAANDAPADFALGQPDLLSDAANNGGIGAGTLNLPWAVTAAGGKLFVADTGNNRILIWNTIPTTTGAGANVAVGAPDLMTAAIGTSQSLLSSPVGIYVVGTKLIVCDLGNNRVLIWNSIPTMSGAPADLVLGQTGMNAFAIGAANDSDGNGMTNGAPTASTLNQPFGVWSDGTRLVVADGGNNRVLIWNTFPLANGEAADLVLGQAAFNTSAPATTLTGMRVPTDVTSDGTKLIVGDCENNRVLIFDAFPVASNTAPTTVLGQGVFTLGAPNDDNQDGIEDAGPTAKTIDTGGGFLLLKLFGTDLYIGDLQNSRALIHRGQ